MLHYSYAHLRKVHIVGVIKSATDAFNASLILNHQNALEVFTIDNCHQAKMISH